MNKVRIYLDNCCYNRPYDNQSLKAISLEAEAKLYVQDNIRDGKIELTWSFMLDFENSANPYEERKSSIEDKILLKKASRLKETTVINPVDFILLWEGK